MRLEELDLRVRMDKVQPMVLITHDDAFKVSFQETGDPPTYIRVTIPRAALKELVTYARLCLEETEP